MATESKDLEQRLDVMNRYSRQIGTYGVETMAKLMQLKVLIVGLKGVGVETAKNVVLAGPASVTLHDPTKAARIHQGVNFFVPDESLGQRLDAVAQPQLAALNSGVTVAVLDELSPDVVSQFNVVVMTEGTRAQLLTYNAACRAASPPVAFIAARVFGVLSYAFSDFGATFSIHDANGEQPITRAIANVEVEEEIVELVSEGGAQKFLVDLESEHEGWVTFSDVKGMDVVDTSKFGAAVHSVNDLPPSRAAAVTGRGSGYRVKVPGLKAFGPYEGGGVLTQVKRPVERHHKTLAEATMDPSIAEAIVDFTKMDSPAQVHIAVQAVYEFEASAGRLPNVRSAEDAAVVLTLARKLNAEAAAAGRLAVEEVKESYINAAALLAGTELQPLACFMGGLVAQEVVKVTGKYTPMAQWLHFDFLEVLPAAPMGSTAAADSRYDHMIQIFGSDFADQVGAASTFMVGCGALGCELLKNFALLGLATRGGKVTVTDNDTIEVSNLNRQFLFRSHNVGQFKSEAARNSVLAMNPAINIQSLKLLVHEGTEDTFNEQFWTSLSFVTNALDNVKARKYVDGQCVFFEKPLLESGTLGTKFNTMVVVPHLTQSYADGPEDAEANDIPMCTLRNFPSLIDHCIEWGRAQFTDTFVQPPADANKFVADRAGYLAAVRKEVSSADNKANALATVIPRLNSVLELCSRANNCTWERLLQVAYNMFHKLFRDNIQSLILAYPKDHVNSEDGKKFWSGGKRFPTPATFDATDDRHVMFLLASASIYAKMFNVAVPAEQATLDSVRALVPSLVIPEFVRESVGTDPEESDFNHVMEALEALEIGALTCNPQEFEKDDDSNFHIDFITSMSNLRAVNYGIPVAARHKVKMIAGKIIPAIATATACATGLVCIEMLKVLQALPLSAYRNSYNNLSVNVYFFEEPTKPAPAKAEYSVIELADVIPKPDGFTKWDKTVIAGDLTTAQFIQAFKDKTGLIISQLMHPIANKEGFARFLLPIDDDEERLMNMKFRDYIAELYHGADIIDANRSLIPLDVSCEDEEGNLYKVPRLLFQWK